MDLQDTATTNILLLIAILGVVTFVLVKAGIFFYQKWSEKKKLQELRAIVRPVSET